jgi:hypothetical protein
MPVGTYRVMDGEGRAVGTEVFRCAPGPAGWRYVSTIETSEPEPHLERVDLVADDRWRPFRVVIETGAHHLVLAADGDALTAMRDGEPIAVPFGPEVELDYLSPAFNAVTANRRRETGEFDVIYVEPYVCEPVAERQRYDLVGMEQVVTPVGRFEAQRWRYSSLRTGHTADFWLSADVVVAYEGLYDLVEYEAGASGPTPS